MLDDFSDHSHRAEVALPSFGSLCARALRLAGLDPLSLASKKQRDWINAANAALGALEKGGALTHGYAFIAYDERWSVAPLNWLASSSAERYGKPSGSSCAHSLSTPPGPESPPVKLRAVGASLEGRLAREGFERMAEVFGSAQRARIFTVAHEFGHSWHAAHNFPWTRAAARAPSLFSDELSRLSDRYSHPDGPDTASKAPAQLLRGLFEECAADAVACWALERADPCGAVERAIAFRELPEPSGSASLPHQTAWFLKALLKSSASLTGPESFDQFCQRAEALFERLGPVASAVFAPASSAPKAPKP